MVSPHSLVWTLPAEDVYATFGFWQEFVAKRALLLRVFMAGPLTPGQWLWLVLYPTGVLGAEEGHKSLFRRQEQQSRNFR